MRSLLALLLAAAVGAALAACGSSSGDAHVRGANAGAGNAGAQAHRKKDRDNDEDNNDDDEHVLAFGQPAQPAERRAITALVDSYFAAAAAENGHRACALLTPFVAQSVPEMWGHTAALRGRSCPVVMTKLFKLHHALLAGKQATMQVIRVGVEGDHSLIALEFGSIHEARQMPARRVGGRWTILYLLDTIIE